MRAVEPEEQLLFTLNTGTPVRPSPGGGKGEKEGGRKEGRKGRKGREGRKEGREKIQRMLGRRERNSERIGRGRRGGIKGRGSPKYCANRW